MKTKINELSKAVGITTAYQLQKKTDLSPSQAARLYRDEVEAISISVLEKLCDALQTSPNDIFGYNEPQKVKRPSVPRDTQKPASNSETPKTIASAKGMTTEQVAERLAPIAGKILSSRRILDYVQAGKLKSEQSGNRTARFFTEADYLEFEAWYRQSKSFNVSRND
jgi:DNA-binding Xre family transcriptional regulator